MFLGWYDPDKKIPARSKLEDALERYARKFGRPALTCITSPEDAAELEADKEAPTMPVRGVGFIPRYTFYVGIDEEAEAVVQPAAGILPSAGERKSVRRKVPAVQSDVQETTTVVKTRRRYAAKATTVPESRPRANRTESDPGEKSKAHRPKTNAEVKPEKPPARTVPPVKPGETLAKTNRGSKPEEKVAKTDQGVKREATRPGSKVEVKPRATPTTTDTGSKPKKSPVKTEQGVKPGAKKTGAKRVSTGPGSKPGSKTDGRLKPDSKAEPRLKPSTKDPESKPKARPTKSLRR